MHQKNKVIPEVALCANFQAIILKSIDISAAHIDYYQRRIKLANRALVLVFSSIGGDQLDLTRPLAELTNGFIRNADFKQLAAYEQAMVRELFRRTVDLLRKDQDLFLQSVGCDTLTELSTKLATLGRLARDAYRKQNEASENGAV